MSHIFGLSNKNRTKLVCVNFGVTGDVITEHCLNNTHSRLRTNIFLIKH